jgi:acyl carrier protein
MTDPYDISKLTVRIAEIIIDELKLEDVTPETFDPEIDLIDEVGIDSMDLATVALVLRDEYGIVIDEDDYPKLNNILRIAQYIQERMTEGKQG